MKGKMIYLDNAATTPVAREVFEAMMPFFMDKFGNASSIHHFGEDAKKALEDSRKKVAELINAEAGEIVFTSGGSESNNLAIKGVVFGNNKKHIITTAIEHPSVLRTFEYLHGLGFKVTTLSVNKEGFVAVKDVENAIREDTLLVSVMHANNEIGTIQPIAEIGKVCRAKGIIFHTDAVQSFGKVKIDVKEMCIDLMSASSHKINGPKGVGMLYVNKGIKNKLAKQIHGGSQENNLRAGTENIAGIVGFARACEIARVDDKTTGGLRDMLIKGALKIKGSWLNGAGGDNLSKRLVNNVNLGFKSIEGEAMLLRLDAMGIAGSTGSACSSHSLKPSHVLSAIGLSAEKAHGSLRLTLGRETTKKNIEYVLKVLPKVVMDLREISPLKIGDEK